MTMIVYDDDRVSTLGEKRKANISLNACHFPSDNDKSYSDMKSGAQTLILPGAKYTLVLLLEYNFGRHIISFSDICFFRLQEITAGKHTSQ